MSSTCSASRLTIHDPRLTHESDTARRGYVTTSTGIRIGISARPRPQPLHTEAHLIQSALLDPATAAPISMLQRVRRALYNWL